MCLLEIIRKKKLQVYLKKVKAYSGDLLNDKVDKLAKEGRNFPEIIWKDPRCPLWSALPIWNQIAIDISLREFIKEIHKKETLIEWCQQNRIQKRWVKEIEEQNKYSWTNFWKHCRQGSSLQTSPKQAKERNFRIKLINDELPTLLNLKKRKPNIYKDATCPTCKTKEEDTRHLFDCSASLNDRLQIWNEVKQKIVVKFQEINNKKEKNNSIKDYPTNLIQLINQWETQFSNSSQDLINMCLGLFDNSKKQTWIQKAKEDGLRNTDSQIILNLLSHKLLKLFRKKIWIPRCERTIAWERSQGIDSMSKKRKKRNETWEKEKGKTRSTSPKTSKPPEQHRKEITRRIPRERKEENMNLSNKVKEVIWSLVKEGKKWLGF
jgi:hypothetical protein